MTFSGKRILVTGGTGFLAWNLVSRLPVDDCHIRCVTRAQGLANRACTPGNIADRSFWSDALPGTDFVFHFAAQTSVYLAEENPAADWRANVLPMLCLLESCRQSGCRPLILFAGTATQCGLPERMPVDESQPDLPVTVYDRHKLEAETCLKDFTRSDFARGTVLRLSNIYGPGPPSGNPDRGVLNTMMRRALRGEALTIYGEGNQVRDYLFSTDAADAFIAAAAHPEAVNGRHFIASSGEGHTLARAFELVAERAALLSGVRVPVTSVEPPAGLSRIEERSFIGDTSSLRAATGWEARIALSEGIDRTLKSIQREKAA